MGSADGLRCWPDGLAGGGGPAGCGASGLAWYVTGRIAGVGEVEVAGDREVTQDARSGREGAG
jgi:hypothetical protein